MTGQGPHQQPVYETHDRAAHLAPTGCSACYWRRARRVVDGRPAPAFCVSGYLGPPSVRWRVGVGLVSTSSDCANSDDVEFRLEVVASLRSACCSAASTGVLLSRFSGGWDRCDLNEPTIAFTRRRSSAAARAQKLFRSIAITPSGADARVLAVGSDRPGQASRTIAHGESDRARRLARRPDRTIAMSPLR